MTAQPLLSAKFLDDLDIVCLQDDNGKLPSTFVNDLENAYSHAERISPPEPTSADLVSLAENLKSWRRHFQILLQQYLAQLPPDDPLLSPVSLFGTMDYGRLETAHTRVLAWLLSDKEHGFGFQLLEALLRYLMEDMPLHLTHVYRVESEFAVFCGPRRSNMGRIDVFAEGCWKVSGKKVPWRLAIEAKIDADEGEEQLSLYDDWLGLCPQEVEVLRVFLTSEGRVPRTCSAEWKPLSFLDMARDCFNTRFGTG